MDDDNSNVVGELAENAPGIEAGLLVGDRIVKLNDVEVSNIDEIRSFMRENKENPITIPVNDFLNPTALTTINQNVLMCQTGYLTLRSALTSGDLTVDLGIPNGEIYKALNRLLAINF